VSVGSGFEFEDWPGWDGNKESETEERWRSDFSCGKGTGRLEESRIAQLRLAIL